MPREREPTTAISVRLPASLLARLDRRARVYGRTRNGELVWLLSFAVDGLPPLPIGLQEALRSWAEEEGTHVAEIQLRINRRAVDRRREQKAPREA